MKKIYKSPIPKDASYEEIAEFWDTHDLGDYLEFTKPVEFEIKLPLSSRIVKDEDECLSGGGRNSVVE